MEIVVQIQTRGWIFVALSQSTTNTGQPSIRQVSDLSTSTHQYQTAMYKIPNTSTQWLTHPIPPIPNNPSYWNLEKIKFSKYSIDFETMYILQFETILNFISKQIYLFNLKQIHSHNGHYNQMCWQLWSVNPTGLTCVLLFFKVGPDQVEETLPEAQQAQELGSSQFLVLLFFFEVNNTFVPPKLLSRHGRKKCQGHNAPG